MFTEILPPMRPADESAAQTNGARLQQHLHAQQEARYNFAPILRRLR